MNQGNANINYENQIVAFVDILGFKEIIKNSVQNLSKVNLLYQALEFLKRRENSLKWNLKLIEVEEDAQKIGVEKFDIEGLVNCSCFSDSIVVSIKVTDQNINELTSTLITNLSFIGAQLMQAGILIRGGISVGKMIHLNNGILMGPALIEAYQLETNSAKFPRIILSKKLLEKLNYPLEEKRRRYPYHQYLNRFDDGCVGFHQMIYYQVLQNSSHLSNRNLKAQLKKIKKTIIDGLDDHFESAETYQKYAWLKKQYEELAILTDDKSPIFEVGSHNIHFYDSNRF
ncbi:MAG: hypothetical protein V4572_09845 [Bacteroidota bacterium]